MSFSHTSNGQITGKDLCKFILRRTLCNFMWALSNTMYKMYQFKRNINHQNNSLDIWPISDVVNYQYHPIEISGRILIQVNTMI